MDARTAAPFVGLRPFEEEDSHLFFGRRNQMNELLERLESTRLVAIVGSSGCGKSSIVRAGLVPALKAGFLLKSRAAWRVLVIKPGKAPIRHLAAAVLGDGAGGEGASEEAVAAFEQEIRLAGAEAVLERLAGSAERGEHNVLLVVDQFEEIFRFGLHEKNQELRDEAADFVSVLLALAEESALPVYVVLTMRADFIRDCDDIQDLPDALNRSLFLVPRLTREQFREAIEGPVRWSDAAIANRLLDRLLNDSNREHDELPVLQHALLRTWREWSKDGRGPMDTEHYEHAGTVERALDLDAEAALEGLDEAGIDRVRRLFQALTAVDDANRKIRRPARLGELEHITGLGREEILPLLERFRADGRSLLVWSDADPDPLIDISHESLIRNWKRLTAWAEEEAESVVQYRRLAEAAGDYPDRGGLLWDPRLQIGLDWRSRCAPTRTWGERVAPGADFERAMGFLDESRQARETARARREREKEEAHERDLAREREAHRLRLRGSRRLLATAAGFLVVMMGLAVFALGQWRAAETQKAKAEELKTYHSLVSQTWTETQAYPARGLLLASAALSRDLSKEDVPGSGAGGLASGERAFLRALSRSGGRAVASGDGPLATLLMTPGDRWLVSVDADGGLTCWESPAAGPAEGTRRRLRRRIAGAGGVVAATMAGDRLVVGTAGGEVRAVSPAPDGCPAGGSWPVARLGAPVRTLAASPDGRWLVALGAERGEIVLLDFEAREPAAATAAREMGVAAVAIGGELDRPWLAVGHASGAVELRPLGADGFAGPGVEVEGGGAPIKALAAAPGSSRLLVARANGKTGLFDASDLPARPRLVSEAVSLGKERVVAAEIRPDGQRLAAWGDDGAVTLWDLAADPPREVSRLPSSGEGGLYRGAFSGAGKWLFTAHLLSGDRGLPWEVRRWRLTAFDPAAETLEHALPKAALREPIRRLAFSPDRTRALVLDTSGALSLWCLCPRGDCREAGGPEGVCREGVHVPARTWGHEAGQPKVGAAAFAADGGVVVAWRDRGVEVFPPAAGPRELAGRAERWAAGQAGARHGEIELGGRRAMTAAGDGRVDVWDLEGGAEPIFSARLSPPVLAARFFGGRHLITAGPTEPLRIHDLSSDAPGAVIETSRDLDIRALDVSPDGRWLAAGSSEGLIWFWRITAVEGGGMRAELDETLTLVEGREPVVAVAFTPDGEAVLVTTEAGTTRRWPVLPRDRFLLARDLVGEGALPAAMQESLELGTHAELFAALLQSAGRSAGPTGPITLASKDHDTTGLERPERRTW
jgi:WD40 repeat protein